MPYRESVPVQDELKKWLVRRVECIRGEVDLGGFESLLPDEAGFECHAASCTLKGLPMIGMAAINFLI